jgi:hypothetical protein
MREFGPEDAWLSAGFVRNAVFTHMFGPPRIAMVSDLDVIYFDENRTSRERDRRFERALTANLTASWSVKNQASFTRPATSKPRSRMTLRRRVTVPAYTDVGEALSHFPETATAVAVRLGNPGLEVLAPCGLKDLRAGLIRATPHTQADVFAARCAEKRWTERWPGVRVEALETVPRASLVSAPPRGSR